MLDQDMTINQVCDLYQAHADDYYQKHGRPTRAASNVRDALRELRTVCGSEPASSFSARRLRAVQQAMIDSGRLCRRTINDRLQWIRAMWRWAAEQELVDELLPHRLSIVRQLQRGRCKAKETRGVKPVLWEIVSSTMAHASLRLATMIEVQWHTGMRPAELVQMAVSMIDRSSEPWIYAPAEHKTEHHGQDRLIPLGPICQGLLRPWIDRAQADGRDYLWPRRTGRGRVIADTPMQRTSFYREIAKVNAAHGIPKWAPNQIRHAAATRLRAEVGIEAARVILGHRSASTTQIYAEVDRQKAIDLMRRFG